MLFDEGMRDTVTNLLQEASNSIILPFFKNLRKATIQQNSSNRLKGTNNTSGHKSITYQSHQTSNPYVVCMHQQNKSHYVGSFPTLEMALEARDKKGKELYGKFYNP